MMIRLFMSVAIIALVVLAFMIEEKMIDEDRRGEKSDREDDGKV